MWELLITLGVSVRSTGLPVRSADTSSYAPSKVGNVE